MTFEEKVYNTDVITGYRLDCRILSDFLVIDDEVDIINFITRLVQLRKADSKVIGITSAKQALSEIPKLDTKKIKCAIVDINFPDGDGLDIVRALLKKDKSLPVVIYSASKKDVLRAQEEFTNISVIEKYDLSRLYEVLGIKEMFKEAV